MNILSRCFPWNTRINVETPLEEQRPTEKPGRTPQGPITDYQEFFEDNPGKEVLGSYALTEIIEYLRPEEANSLQILDKATYKNIERCMGTRKMPLRDPRSFKSVREYAWHRPGESEVEFFARRQYEKAYEEKRNQLPFMQRMFIDPLLRPAWDVGLFTPLVDNQAYVSPEAIRSYKYRTAEPPTQQTMQQIIRQRSQADRR